MKIDNPTLPPFSKGGEGGFETYFLSSEKNGTLVLKQFKIPLQIWRFFKLATNLPNLPFVFTITSPSLQLRFIYLDFGVLDSPFEICITKIYISEVTYEGVGCRFTLPDE
jgi:hypothetical protein